MTADKPAPPFVVNVTTATFETEVIERSRQVPVVVDFWAPWCGPCQALGPLLEKLATEADGKFILVKVDIDKEPALAEQFRVSSIPLVVGMIDGEPVDYFAGALPEAAIQGFLDRLIPSPSQTLTKQAAQLETTDPVQAQNLYAQAVDADPKNTVARAGWAELLLDANQPAAASEALKHVGEGTEGWPRAKNVLARLEFLEVAHSLGTVEESLARIQKNPKDRQAALDLGLILAAAGRWEEALEQMVQIVEADRAFGNEHVKSRMVQIFGILGQTNELTSKYRPRLASALY